MTDDKAMLMPRRMNPSKSYGSYEVLLRWSWVLLGRILIPGRNMKVFPFAATVALLLQAAQGFVPSSRTRDISRQISVTQLQEHPHSGDRREWLADTARILVVGGGGILSLPSSSNAAIATLVAQEVTKTEYPPSLCDPSISTWKNPSNNRVVHILGTAHISEASAELAGVLVKEVRPNAVFVELDRKRISRAMPKGSGETDAGSGAAAPTTSSTQNAEMASKMADGPNAVAASAGGGSNAAAVAVAKEGNPFAVKERVLNAGAKMVGDAIKSMYSKLDNEGFKAGEEFVIAIREGLALNAAIVLGDRDVEVTLRRLTEALSKTDLKKLFASDSDLEKAMDSLMPNGSRSATMAAMSGGESGKDLTNTGGEKISKEQFKEFVETVKARENVRLVMSKLRETAPELYNAMVAERDVYMANGIDKLDQFEKMVAVVGIAHVDGIEANLKERGWMPVSIPCQLR